MNFYFHVTMRHYCNEIRLLPVLSLFPWTFPVSLSVASIENDAIKSICKRRKKLNITNNKNRKNKKKKWNPKPWAHAAKCDHGCRCCFLFRSSSLFDITVYCQMKSCDGSLKFVRVLFRFISKLIFNLSRRRRFLFLVCVDFLPARISSHTHKHKWFN